MISTTVTNAESILKASGKTKDVNERIKLEEEFINHPHITSYHLSSDDLPLIKLGWLMASKRSREFPFQACAIVYSQSDRTPNEVLDIIQSAIIRRIIAPIEVTDTETITEADNMITAEYDASN